MIPFTLPRPGGLLILLALLPACQATVEGGAAPILTASEEIAKLRPLYDAAQVRAYFECGDDPCRSGLRNRIVPARLHAIDISFSAYSRALSAELRAGKFGTNLLSLALSGTATALASPAAVTVLNAVDTGLKGSVISFDREMLAEQTLPILLSTMESRRRQIATEILTGLRQPDSDYPLIVALTQLEDYQRAGTINGSLLKLSEEAASAATAAEQGFRSKLILSSYGETPVTRRLSDWAYDPALTPEAQDQRIRALHAEIDRLGGTTPEGERLFAAVVIQSADPRYIDIQNRLATFIETKGN